MSNKEVYLSRPWLKHYGKGVPANIDYDEVCVHEFLAKSVEKFPDHIGFIFMGYKITYRNFDIMVNRVAGSLYEMGIRQGDVVAILLPNMIQTAAAYYAVLKLGGIVQMNNPLYTDRELAYQFNDSKAKLLITLDILAERMINLRNETTVKKIIYTSIGDYLPGIKKVLFNIAGKKKGMKADVPASEDVFKWLDIVKKDKPFKKADVKFDDVAVYQYTGGTTGMAKGAVLTHRNLSSMVQMYDAWFTGFEPAKEVVISAPPIFHILGMSAALNFPVFKSWTAIMVPKPQAKELLEATRKYRPSICSMVPTMYVGMLQHPDLKKTDMSCFKVLSSGASSLPVEVMNQFHELTGAHINEGFGMTETSPQTHLNPYGGKHKPGSIGLPYPDTDVRIVDLETGTEDVAPGEEGEMIFRGPQVTSGYLNKPEETAETIRDGWLYSGDIAYMDKDGYFFIVDRKKDIILSSGYNVYPREIEEILYEHPKIQKAAAIGIPDAKRGEKIKVFIVPNENDVVDAKEVMEYCEQKLAKYKLPSEIEIRDSLPESNVGKILKKELRKEEEDKRKGGQ